jgi:hypothetical protein
MMNIQSDWLSIYIALLGTIISALLAYLSYSLDRQSQRASMQRAIEDLYDKMVEYRSVHPEALKLCNRWNENSFDSLYRQGSTEEVQWVVYYNYVELISGFSNAVLYGHKIKLLDKHAYEGHYKPLVKLLVTENYPYFLSILDFPYLSSLIKEFIHELKNEGWDFSEKHRKLIGASSKTAIQTPMELRKGKQKS